MYIVLVSSQHHPTHGGIGAYVQEFANACATAGWRVDLITRPSVEGLMPRVHRVHEVVTGDMEPSFDARIRGLRQIERIRPYRYGLWSLAVAEKLLEVDGRPDVIEFVDCQAEGFVSLTSRRVRSRFHDTSFVVSAHTPMWLHEKHAGADLQRFGRSIYHAWERSAVAAADGVIAPSRALMDRIEPTVPMLVAPFPMRAVPAAAPSGSQMILLIGAIQPQKGVDVWARSLNRILLARPKATAVLIGTDTPTAPDGLSMAAHVQRLIDRRVLDRFRWIGAAPHEQVARFIEDAAIVVVPSVFESFSFAAAEAVMRGRPVVVSDRVGLCEHVPGLSTVPVGDADALAEAQLEILGDLSTAHDRAMEIRQALIDACEPEKHLRLRERFIRMLVRHEATAVGESKIDAIDQMSDWLRAVETEETELNSDERRQTVDSASASLAVSP